MTLLKLLRVRQWIKNAFVLAPLLFSLKFVNFSDDCRAGLAFFAFCFVSSFAYIINDIIDRKLDALHPVKKNRPIASGKVSVPLALLIASFMLLFSGIFLYVLGNVCVAFMLLFYVVLNFAYSFKLKKIVLIDVFAIAASFLLRLYAGAYAIGVPVSHFIFLTTLFLALFLGFSKRKVEMLGTHHKTRDVLKYYTLANINCFTVIAAGMVIIFYALYTIEPRTIARFGTDKLIYSIVFVVYGVFRYFQILDRPENTEDPTENLLKDFGLLSVCFLYVVYVVLIFMKVI